MDKAIIKEHFGAGLDSKKLPFMEKLLLKIIGKCRDFCEMDSDAIERTAKAVNSIKRSCS